jgi:succinate dehydrogenase / fumarate reductase cytochrome b subunit
MYNKRYKFINLFALAPHMSITAKVSILHRITGILMFLLLPLFIYILHQLGSDVFALQELWQVIAQSWLLQILYVFISWVVVFYICAEIRFLLLDIDIGSSKSKAVLSAWLVLALSVVLTATLYIISII